MKINLSDRKLFLYLPAVIYTRRDGLGEFETIMQTRDAVKDLHHFLELSQPPEVGERNKYYITLTAID